MFTLRRKKQDIKLSKIPAHIGIIMDGNGRWAKKRMKPRVFGHKAGMDALQDVTIAASELGVKILTVYAFSTEQPAATLDALERARELTKHNSGLILNFALNYGGRAEIVDAVKLIAQDVLDARFNPGDITEGLIADYLMTSNLPYLYRDPDLIIRTSGELRLSNFLPWQAAYSELYFTDTLWPDFDKKALYLAIEEFNHRHRRFGGV